MTIVQLDSEVSRLMGCKKISTEPQPSTVGPLDLIDETVNHKDDEAIPGLFKYNKPKDENPQLTNHQQISQEPDNQTFADIG